MRRALAASLACLALAPPALAAAPAAPRTDLVDVEDEVMCVTCKVPLNIAEGSQPDSERAFIRELIAQGKTKAQIKRALVAEYGEDVLALPDDGGFGATAYVVPLALGGLIVAGVAIVLPRWRRRAAAEGGVADVEDAPDELSAEDAERLDADLARYDG